jgi:glutamate dehydrogenase
LVAWLADPDPVHRRNCLIVEGGAKAAILPNLDANFTLCFENFVDAVIDLLIPGQSPGIKEKIVDLSGRKDPEVLFFGPDENTAGLMDWACFHARKRNAPWWKVS